MDGNVKKSWVAPVVVLACWVTAACTSETEAVETAQAEVAPAEGSSDLGATEEPVGTVDTGKTQQPNADTQAEDSEDTIGQGGSNEYGVVKDAVLPPGRYETNTDVPIRFSIPDRGDDVQWRGRILTDWGVSILLNTDISLSGGGNETPGLHLATAEPGATVDSVSEAIVASQPETSFLFDVSEGKFVGKDATIITARSQRQSEGWGIKAFATGSESYVDALQTIDREITLYVFDVGDRVAIVALNYQPEHREVIVAEAAFLFESLEYVVDDPA
jgi:hypothetical protein